MSGADSSRWIRRFTPRPQARLRLFCLPYAGAGASLFRTLSEDLPPEVEVCPIQLPGRENRLAEAAFARIEPLVESLAPALLPWLDRPFAFFGHSMGALIAFELAGSLHRTHRLLLSHLFVSGCAAPHLHHTERPIHGLPEPEFVDELRRLGGTPEEVLQHAELLQILIPLLRADLALVETYTYAGGEPLDCPLSAFAAEHDARASRAEVEGWQEQTRGPFRLRVFSGEHFFLKDARAQVAQAIHDDLRPHLR